MPGNRGQCRKCGDEIWWWSTVHGKTYPPLVPVHKTVLAEVRGVMYSAQLWDVHRCPEELDQEYIDKVMAVHQADLDKL
jgi:hypothetical protein